MSKKRKSAPKRRTKKPVIKASYLRAKNNSKTIELSTRRKSIESVENFISESDFKEFDRLRRKDHPLIEQPDGSFIRSKNYRPPMFIVVLFEFTVEGKKFNWSKASGTRKFTNPNSVKEFVIECYQEIQDSFYSVSQATSDDENLIDDEDYLERLDPELLSAITVKFVYFQQTV